MKAAIYVLTFFTCIGVMHCQTVLKINGKKTNYVSIRNTNVFCNKYEVTNAEYLTFLAWVKVNETEQEYQFCLPDTTVWKTPLNSLDQNMNYYLRHPAFNNYPVVGISYEQAVKYCKWKTDQKNKELKDKQIKKIVFRLPKEEEWEIAARGGLSDETKFPWGTSNMRIEKGRFQGAFQANFMRGKSDFMGVAGSLNNDFDVTAPVNSFWPNNFGIYNIAGNVAEMIEEKSITKGGGWMDERHKLVISTRDTMAKAEKWVGFRIFAEVEEYQNHQTTPKINAHYIEKNLVYHPAGGHSAPGYSQLFGDTSDIFVQQAFHLFKFEVSNQLFDAFLNSITDSVLKKSYLPKDKNWFQETSLLQYQHYSSQFPNHPVVNITKEAMIAFCNWLTDFYNTDSKRAYTKVRFSLPSVNQQIVAGQCGLTFNNYSWGGPYHEDGKGHYLMNYNPLFDFEQYNDEKLASDLKYREKQLNLLRKSRALDGFELTAPVNAFSPCSRGLFNLNGNVAEAVLNSDYVFGGSFASMTENCQNLGGEYSFLEKITLPSTQVGFRFVMDVIEK